MRALSIRQPYVELILRGEKVVEYRSVATRLIGERFYLYAAPPKTRVEREAEEGIAASGHQGTEGLGRRGLPTGVLVGSAVIARCVQRGDWYEWHLAEVRRLKQPRRPGRKAQPVWFNPF